ncbi:hypothetical protein BET03_08235 [Thermohalobacter berrensis]|uniref:Ubiquinone biosynthesis protein UbiA n=2 Tax=Thermohalobacter berrensis TaxID=99594 RepID=A0A419T8Y6_9FIRM|nr:hypothetical protein BET03_08235 [Thermohalobacter berrensis]
MILFKETSSKLKGIYKLIRMVPVIGWCMTSSLLALAFAIGNIDINYIVIINFILAMLILIILHGIVSHSINDKYDWISYTDQKTRGILSGGSKVLKKGLLTIRDLDKLAIIGIISSLLIATFFVLKFGFLVFIGILIGIWSAVTYSLPPFRFSYKPFLGEWFCAFPALVTATNAVYYILTGRISFVSILISLINAFLCIGWLMHHHISDIEGDMRAFPIKKTTVLFTVLNFGREYAVVVPIVYYIFSLLLSFAGLFYISKAFLIPAIISLTCIILEGTTNTLDIDDITKKENYMSFLVIINPIIILLYRIGGIYK